MNRLSFAFIFACTVAIACPEAGEVDPGRVAIVDASINTTPYLDAFAKAGIKVIGRYYSRCPQPDIVPEKRLIDNLGEIEAIRSHGFGVLSIYQYFNNQPLKFAGKRKISCRTKKGESRTIEVTLPGPDCTPRPIEDCTEAEGPPHGGAEEAELDARAAIAQAKLVGQPLGTAIYFGIDFDLKPELNERVVQYFTIVSDELKDKGYLVGVLWQRRGSRLAESRATQDRPTCGPAACGLYLAQCCARPLRRRRVLQSRRVGPLPEPDRSAPSGWDRQC